MCSGQAFSDLDQTGDPDSASIITWDFAKTRSPKIDPK